MTVTRLIIRADGAARGNPGPASAGAVLVDADRPGAARPDAPPLATISEALGIRTNNVAEYTAVLRALDLAAELGAREVDLLLDSLLVVEQLRGRWRVRDAKLAPLHAAARARLAGFRRWSAAHVPRAQNHQDEGGSGIGSPPSGAAPGSEASAAPSPARAASRAVLEPGFDPGDAGPDPGRLVVTLLGTGTSGGVPRVACRCATCTSTDPRDRRQRCSALLAFGPRRVLIDAGPDLRAQVLEVRLDRLDAVLLTHEHADAIGGLDELRVFNEIQGAYLPVHALPECLAVVMERFRYAFRPGQTDYAGVPQLRPVEIAGPFLVGGRRFVPVPVVHGEARITGFRTGSFAYLTDVLRIEPDGRALLRGLEVLVVSALRDEPHPTHQTVAEALALLDDLRPRRTILTHLDHDLRHADLAARLPAGVEIGVDGMVIDLG
ncbi:MAG: MBL fold metallo-hydrolase [Chloroflexi bacterium]|nr:MBL fold metallo-hydrolase [Chloroflexota bacterium]